ncbi:MAG TPA: hypothetical protein VHV82_16000 [Sporichthyaceae bacterium]|jgi:hypothetical protein|nr:hypothetical protein [Sporichthyaceae bacterium]
MFHDLGLTAEYRSTDQRFEIDAMPSSCCPAWRVPSGLEVQDRRE